MLKQSLLYLVLSILVVIFAKFAHLLIMYIGMFYAFMTLQLTPIFNQSGLGLMVGKIILLIATPALITAIPALTYRFIKGGEMPYVIELTWCLWLVIVLSNILIY